MQNFVIDERREGDPEEDDEAIMEELYAMEKRKGHAMEKRKYV